MGIGQNLLNESTLNGQNIFSLLTKKKLWKSRSRFRLPPSDGGPISSSCLVLLHQFIVVREGHFWCPSSTSYLFINYNFFFFFNFRLVFSLSLGYWNNDWTSFMAAAAAADFINVFNYPSSLSTRFFFPPAKSTEKYRAGPFFPSQVGDDGPDIYF